jgi:tetratricopeptide (TPR) repeat protein
MNEGSSKHMTKRAFAPFMAALLLAAGASAGDAGRFEWSTKSEEAKKLLLELQGRIESFQFGPDNVTLAQKIVATDPSWCLGTYYLSAVTPLPEAQKHLDQAVELAKNGSEGERRFITAMGIGRANQGADFPKVMPDLEKIAADYPKERLVRVILGQIYQGNNEAEKARKVFEEAESIGPPSPRVRSFLANDDLLKGDYEKARATFLSVEKTLPRGAAPFAVRYGLAFAYLYEGKVDPALEALRTYLAEYKDSGAAQGFPEVFIWNSMARINLENGRLEDAMKAYEKGYESVPGSSLPDDQKQIWLGRLHHGRCRTLAKMGKHEEAWTEALTIKKMIDEGGEQGKQFIPSWHYLAGYLKLEAGDAKTAAEELKQIPQPDPFQTLLLARAYDKLGEKENAKKTWQAVVTSSQNGIERAIAFPEAKRKLTSV